MTKDDLNEQIERCCEAMDTKWFNPYKFIQKYPGVHQEALLNVLQAVKRKRSTIRNPWAYALAALKEENQRCHAADAEAAHEALKQDLNRWSFSTGGFDETTNRLPREGGPTTVLE